MSQPPVPPSRASISASSRRARPGERRIQILQMLARMLESGTGERVTTAALAARLDVSEAALYRHFASKAQMFDSLIDFIEQSVFGLVNQITVDGTAEPTAHEARQQALRIAAMLLQFGEKNPGLVRVMTGEALVLEHPRLGRRIEQFFDKLEAALRQCLRHDPDGAAALQAGVLMAFCIGRLQRYARSEFRRRPTEQLDASLALLLR